MNEKNQPPSGFFPNEGHPEAAQNNEQLIDHHRTTSKEQQEQQKQQQYLLYQNLLNQNSFPLNQNLLARTTQSLSSISISRPQTPEYNHTYQPHIPAGQVNNPPLTESPNIPFPKIISRFECEPILSRGFSLLNQLLHSNPPKQTTKNKSPRKKLKKSSPEKGYHPNGAFQQFMHIFKSFPHSKNEGASTNRTPPQESRTTDSNASSIMLARQDHNPRLPGLFNMNDLMKGDYASGLNDKDDRERNWEESEASGVNGSNRESPFKMNNLDPEGSTSMENNQRNSADYPSEEDSEQCSNISEEQSLNDMPMDFSSFNRSILPTAPTINPSMAEEATPYISRADTSIDNSLISGAAAIDTPLQGTDAATTNGQPSATTASNSLNTINPFMPGPGIAPPIIPPFPLLGAQPHLPASLDGHLPHADLSTATSHADILARALAAAKGPRKPRGEKKPIPPNQKDIRYYERRKRNNIAAKKSRDARKQRESAIASRATLLEAENSVLKSEVLTLKYKIDIMIRDIMTRGTPGINYSHLNDLNNIYNRIKDLQRPDEDN